MGELASQAVQWQQTLRERADEFEQARCLSADISAGFAADGFYRMLVPGVQGGLEVHPGEFRDVIRNIACGDGSAGWNVMIGATTGLLSASLSEAFAAEVFGDPHSLAVGVTAPLGRAERVPGGYRVTGRWPFASGSPNANWICGGCFIYADGSQEVGARGPEVHLMIFPRADVTVEDTWYVSGLSGTGSHHMNVKDVFVPEGRSVQLGGRTRIERPLYQFPMLGLLAIGVASVSVGIGYRALDAFVELATEKKPTGSSRPLGDRALVQATVAKSKANLAAADAYISSTIDTAWALAQAGERLGVEIKAELRLAAANATHRAVEAVDGLYRAGGGSSIYAESPLQRCFRDVHVTTQHAMVAEPMFEVCGRVLLGADPKSML